ncbi:MAG: hypothetical protein WKG06_47555 [Segetibacter sp.]
MRYQKTFLKQRLDTWYRLSPTDPIPVEVKETTYIGFAYFPGGGTGNATHLGKCYFYFNQLAYSGTVDALPAGSIGAPVIDVINYPVTGGPCLLYNPVIFLNFLMRIIIYTSQQRCMDW